MVENNKNKKRKKIFYVIGSTEVGGAELHLLSISKELVRRGYSCTLFALDPVGRLNTEFEKNGVSVLGVKLPSFINYLICSKKWQSRLRYCIGIPYLLWIYYRLKPSIVHFYLPIAYIFGSLLLLPMSRIKRIMSRRSLNVYQSKRPVLKKLEAWLHKKTDIITGNSQAVIDNLIEEGVCEKKLRLIYNGIDLKNNNSCEDKDIREMLSIGELSLVYVVVANLIPYKGHSDLIDALSMIKCQLPKGWVCLFVGRDDGIGEELENKIQCHGLDQNIQLLGSRSDVMEILLASDIGVNCSHEEGFSNAVLEYMAANLPTVVTDVGGNSEAVSNGSTGLVVKPRSPCELSKALLSLALNENRRYMGNSGYRRLKSKFSMGECLEHYIDLYEA